MQLTRKKIKDIVLLYCILSVSCFCTPLWALQIQFNATSQKDSVINSFLTKLENVRSEPLHLLPKYDCALSDLESEYYLYCSNIVNCDGSSSLEKKIKEKRNLIDKHRIYIDSLYYIEALRQINATEPNWEQALQYIETSLSHNRFFLRSVLFKLSYLQREAEKTKIYANSLNYTRNILEAMSWQPKILSIGNSLYEKVLERIEYLNGVKLYQDALALYDTLHANILPEFHINVQEYRENNILHTAYQGTFNSYFSVAQKAFEKKLYPLSQKHALLANNYYKKHEKYMSGVNRALELLDQHLREYQSFMFYSDIDEKAYYTAMIDSIYLQTGLQLPKTKIVEKEYTIESELAKIDVKEETAENKTKAESDSLYFKSVSTVLIHQRNLSQAQAQKQFDICVENARLLKARRQFIAARNVFAKADSLRRYYPIKNASDFLSESNENDLLAVEQLLNKAQYRLWNSENAYADSLAQIAYTIASYAQGERRTSFQSLLDGYEQQKNSLLCKTTLTQWNNGIKEIQRQISFGNTEKVLLLFERLTEIYAYSTSIESCYPDTSLLPSLCLQVNQLQYYKLLLDSSAQKLSANDSIAFIEYQLKADKHFKQSGMASFIPASSTLFSRLTYLRDFPMLALYAWTCLNDGQKEQCEFVLSYLKEANYTSVLVESLRKQLKKSGKE